MFKYKFVLVAELLLTTVLNSRKLNLLLFPFRVFKKSSPNGKVNLVMMLTSSPLIHFFICLYCTFVYFQITVYLGKRDFVDHLTHVDPIGNLSLTYFQNY